MKNLVFDVNVILDLWLGRQPKERLVQIAQLIASRQQGGGLRLDRQHQPARTGISGAPAIQKRRDRAGQRRASRETTPGQSAAKSVAPDVFWL